MEPYASVAVLYRVLKPVERDGRIYEVGSTLVLEITRPALARSLQTISELESDRAIEPILDADEARARLGHPSRN